MNLKNNLRRAWQWIWGHTYIALMLLVNTKRNNWMYRKACKDADALSQRLNWQRVYIFPNPPDKGPGLRLVTSSMIAEENKHRSKRMKLDIRALLEHSYGWSDKNTSAYENFYRRSKSKRKIRKANRIKKKNIELRKIKVHEPNRTKDSRK